MIDQKLCEKILSLIDTCRMENMGCREITPLLSELIFPKEIDKKYLSAFVTLVNGFVIISIGKDDHSFNITDNKKAKDFLDNLSETFAVNFLFSSSVDHPSDEGFDEGFDFLDWLCGYTE